MPQFDTSTFASQIFWLFICFGILFLFLQYVIVPKITKAISERNIKIQEQITIAKLNALKIEELENQHKIEMLRIKEVVADLLITGKSEINKSFNHNVTLLKTSISEKYKMAESELLNEKSIVNIDEAAIKVANILLKKLSDKLQNNAS